MRMLFAMLLWTRYGQTQLWVRRFAHTDELLLSVLFFVSSTLMFVGLWSRFSTFLAGFSAFVMYYGLGVMGGESGFVHHHTYLLNVCTLFLAGTDCGRSFSVDRWLSLRAARKANLPAPAEHGVLWGSRLIAAQMSVVYLYSAWDKTFLAFPMRVEHHLMDFLFGSDYPPFPGFTAVAFIGAVGVITLEFALPFLLFIRRTRPAAMFAGAALHGVFYVLMPVGTFSLTVMAAYLAYLDPQDVHRWVDDQVRP